MGDVRCRVVEGAGEVVGRDECVDDLTGDGGIGEAAGAEETPPARGSSLVAVGAGRPSERRERLLVAALQAKPFAVGPRLELLGVVEVEAVEERTAVLGDGWLQLPPVERRLEGVDVAPERVAMEPQLLPRADDRRRPDDAPDLVERDAEKIPRRVLVALRPEQSDQLLAAQPGRRREGEAGQQGETVTVRDRAAERPAVSVEDGGPAEQAELEPARDPWCGERLQSDDPSVNAPRLTR